MSHLAVARAEHWHNPHARKDGGGGESSSLSTPYPPPMGVAAADAREGGELPRLVAVEADLDNGMDVEAATEDVVADVLEGAKARVE